MSFRSLRPTKLVVAAVAVGFMALATAAQAHPRLVSASPAANTAISSTTKLKLTFSEALVAQFSGMSVLMTDMPGMKMTAPMSVGAVTSMVAADGKTLVGTLKSPLPPCCSACRCSQSILCFMSMQKPLRFFDP
jgi:methionine-rich copper-binding protein CopC